MAAAGDRKIIVFGTAELAELSHFYWTRDLGREVAAFALDGAYIREASFKGLPVVPFETIETVLPPDTHDMSMLLGYRNVNRFRATKYAEAKRKGYRLPCYISSKALVWPGVAVGENSFILEQAVVQPFASIGDDVFVGPAAIVSHHSRVGDHCFVASHATILGNVVIGDHSVVGAGATIVDGTAIGRECIIGANALVNRDAVERGVYAGPAAERHAKTSDEIGRILTWSNDG